MIMCATVGTTSHSWWLSSLILLWGNQPGVSNALLTTSAQFVFITEFYFAFQPYTNVHGEC